MQRIYEVKSSLGFQASNSLDLHAWQDNFSELLQNKFGGYKVFWNIGQELLGRFGNSTDTIFPCPFLGFRCVNPGG